MTGVRGRPVAYRNRVPTVHAPSSLLATTVSLGSGASGGIFSPSLYMGATLGGAFASAVLVGLLDTAGRIFFPDFALFAIFGPMLLMLAFRPGGLAGQS